ncbi:response regulator [Pontiella sp.]|uniref:response regulator n=1 Tax=Pontiella sp. TaxID=2837462 RepID=UPI0035619D92
MIIVVSIALIFALAFLSASLYANIQYRKTAATATVRYEKSRNRVLQLFENSPDAILIVEKDGRITAANLNAGELLNTDLDLLLKKHISDLVPDDRREALRKKMGEWFLGRQARWETAVQSNEQHLIDVEFMPCLQQVDEKYHLEIHVRDIRVRKDAENKIHAARQMAEDALDMANRARQDAEISSREKSEFLAAMSRDLRIPLHNIVGAGQLLNDGQPIADQREYLQIIQGSSQHLLKVFNHVLDIAKIESGQMETLSENFNVRELCFLLEDRFRPDAAHKGLYLECTCKDNVPKYLTGDPVMIEHVLENLLGNAFSFTESGSVRLTVECRSIGRAGASIYFEVADTGVGISADKQQRIFEKFIYSGEFAKSQPDEAGLGLAISKRQVELMGGILGVNSQSGQGSTFYFNLLMPVAEQGRKAEPHEIADPFRLYRKGLRILLAEDNRLNRKVAEDLLTKAGCRVDTVENGRDAALQVRKADYDAVLMDCEMPVMDGFEGTLKIRKMPAPYCDLPVIALTANAMKDDIEKCTAAGMTAYLSKPISRRRLIEVLNLHVLQA